MTVSPQSCLILCRVTIHACSTCSIGKARPFFSSVCALVCRYINRRWVDGSSVYVVYVNNRVYDRAGRQMYVARSVRVTCLMS